MIRYFFFLLLSLHFQQLSAQPLKFSHFKIQEGYTHNRIHQITTDVHGFLWLATDNGIQRFDGSSFTTFGIKNGIDTVYSILPTPSGKLIAGTSRGLIRFDYSGQIEQIPLTDAIVRHQEPVRILGSVPGKSYWLATSKIVAELDTNFKVLRILSFNDFHIEHGNFIREIKSLVLDQYQTAWIVWKGKLFHLKATGGALETWKSELTQPYFNSLAIQQDGSVWAHALFNSNDSLLKFSDDYKIRYTQAGRTGQDSSVLMTFLHDGRICLATDGKGLIIADPFRQTTIRFLSNSDDEHSISGDHISYVYEDANHLLWVASTEGLNKSSVLSSVFKYILYSGSADSRRFDPPDIQDAVLLNDSTALLSSYSSLGLIKADLKSGNSNVLFPNGNPNHLTHTLRLCKLQNNDWIISSLTGNYIFNELDQSLKPIRVIPGCPELLKQAIPILAMYHDQLNRVWISMVNISGIFCYNLNEKSWKFYSSAPSGLNFFPLKSFSCATEDKDHNIYFGYVNGDGLAIFDHEKQNFSNEILREKDNTIPRIHDLATDPDGKIWIGTSTGLYSYNSGEKTISQIFDLRQTKSSIIKRIVCTEQSLLWITTDNQLLRYDSRSGITNEFGLEDGLLETNFNGGAFLNQASNQVTFTTSNGIVSFDAVQSKFFHTLHPPLITGIWVNGEEQSIEGNEIQLSHQQNNIRFRYTCPDVLNANGIQFSSKLIGFNEDWVNLNLEREVYYSQLPSGKYKFQLRSSLDGINWKEISIPLSLTIKLPFYKSPVFLTLLSIIFLSLVFALYSHRQRIKLRQTILAHDLRNDISRDLHDDIGSAISSIALMSDLAAHMPADKASGYMEKIAETARGLIENMNDIIWVINPGNDKLESVSARMRRFGSTILEAKNIDFHFEGDEILENISLPMNVRRNIYLVFKELINNAAKHSACTFVKVHFRQDQKQIRLSIEDNGKGFELSKSHDGNGMKNIQSRCREIGAKLDISTLPGTGTRFEILLKAIK
ncbi:MAG: hypothetical protein IPO49_01615 [Bacteroidetes bacterium]|nr:hypothetical protein [Bacteroidota bacterium]